MLRHTPAHKFIGLDAAASELGLVPLLSSFVRPTAIASAEAFGTANVNQAISCTAIASAEAFGSGTVRATLAVSPSSIASAEAFGAASVHAGGSVSGAGGIASLESFGTPTVTHGEVITGAGGIASEEAFGIAAIIEALLVSPSSIESAESFGTPDLPTLIGVSNVIIWGPTSPALPLLVGVTSPALPLLAGLSSYELGDLISDRTLFASSIESAEAFGTPYVIADALNVIGIPSEEAFGTPTVITAGVISLDGEGIASLEAFGSATVEASGTLRPTSIASLEAFGDPVVSTVTRQNISVEGIPSAEAFGDVIVALTGQIVVPGTASLQAFGVPLVSLGPAARPVGIASLEAFGATLVSNSGATLLDFSIGNFNRVSEGSGFYNATTFDYFPADVPRIEDMGDGAGPLYLFERLRTEYLYGNTSVGSTKWGAVSGATVDATPVVGPDGDASTGTVVNFTANANSQMTQSISTSLIGDNQVVTFSLFAKIPLGGNGKMQLVVQKKDLTPSTLTITCLTTSWQKFDFTLNCGSGSFGVILRLRNHTDAVARTVHISLPEAKPGNYPTSVIRNPDTSTFMRNTEDVLILLPAQVADYLRGGRWTASLYPKWGSADLISGDIRIVYDFGGSGNDLRFRHDGTGVLLEARVGGVTVSQSGYLTSVRLAAVPITVRCSTGQLGLSGVFGATGTPWLWPPSVLVRVAGPVGSSGNELDGRMTAPRAA